MMPVQNIKNSLTARMITNGQMICLLKKKTPVRQRSMNIDAKNIFKNVVPFCNSLNLMVFKKIPTPKGRGKSVILSVCDVCYTYTERMQALTIRYIDSSLHLSVQV